MSPGATFVMTPSAGVWMLPYLATTCVAVAPDGTRKYFVMVSPIYEALS